MKTLDFNKPITSKELKENIVKQFGANVNLEKYDREQLEDMRNKLRTRVFQQEGVKGFNELLQNEAYQKDKAMLELLNTRIKEMLGEQMQKLRDRMDQLSEAKKGTRPPKTKIAAKGSKPDFLDMDKDGDKKEPMKKAVTDKKAGPKKGVNPFAKVKEGAKPDFLDMDKDGNKEEPMKKAVKDKKVKEGFPTVDDAKKAAAGTAGMKAGEKKKSSTGGTIEKTATGLKHTAGKNYGGQDAPKTPDSDKKAKKSMKESQFKHNVKFVNESLQFLLNEDEEGKAKAITAAGDMVNDFTSWMQRVGQYQTKSMIELADAIRADFGAQEAEQFKQSVGPALSQTLETLTQQRELISNAVAVLAGGAAPEEPMGMEPDMGAPMEPGMEPAGGDAMNPMPAGDEFGAADAAAGGPEAAGRAMRESKEQRRARKLAESHSIMSKLAK
jgi:hypothetical protein